MSRNMLSTINISGCGLTDILLFLYAFGCISTIRPFLYFSLVIFVLLTTLGDYNIDYKSYLKDKFVIYTAFFVGFMVLLFYIANAVNNVPFRKTLIYLERALPCFLLMLFTYKKEEIIKPLYWGIVCGTMFLILTSYYDFFPKTYNANFSVWLKNAKEMRADSYVGIHNRLGGLVALIFPMLSAMAFSLKKHKNCVWMYIFTIINIFIALAIAKARGAFIAVCFISAFGGLYYVYAEHLHLFVKYKKILGLGVLAILLILLGLYFNGNLSRQYDSERLLLWESGLAMFYDNPVFGVGFGNWNGVYNAKYISPLAREPFLISPHNWLLYFLDTVGLVGTSGFILMLGVEIYLLMKWLKTSNTLGIIAAGMLGCIIGMLTHGMVDTVFLMKEYMIIYAFFWGVLGNLYVNTR